MNKNDDSLLSRAGDVALATLVIAWILNFLLTTRLGIFLLLTFIGGFGSFILVCGAINAVAWNCFDYFGLEPETWWWVHLLCWGGAALFSAIYMANRGMWESVDKKCRKIDCEIEDGD